MEFYEAGADDVVTEAVIGRESIMRLTASARRPLSTQSQISFADIVLNPERHRAWRRGKSISLTNFQFQLLQFLMQNPNKVFSRDDFLDCVWIGRTVQPCTISTAVNRLRHVLRIPGAPDLIHTVRGTGYVMDAQ